MATKKKKKGAPARKKRAAPHHGAKKAGTKRRRARPLQKGDFAKLLFTDGSNSERMWVHVGGRLPVRDAYWGLLSNDPLLLSIRVGARVHFKRADVLETLRRKDAEAAA